MKAETQWRHCNYLHCITYIPSSIKPTNRHWSWIHSFRFLVSQTTNLPVMNSNSSPHPCQLRTPVCRIPPWASSVTCTSRKTIPLPNTSGYFLDLKILELVHCRVSQTQVPAQWRSGTSNPFQLQSSCAPCSSPQQEALSLPWDHRIQPLLLKSSGVTLPEANFFFEGKQNLKATS